MTSDAAIVDGVRRKRLRVSGTVQGVGFRPFVHRLAAEMKLSGFINNDAAGVNIEVEGSRDGLRRFIDRLISEAPALASVEAIDVCDVPAQHEGVFRIIASRAGLEAQAIIPPDVAVCDDCLHELFDPKDRRYRYPFINCTNCGPRFTIVRNLPYDRPMTTMVDFEMCEACSEEYHDPANRRFHAQPNACPVCGPRLTAHDGERVIEETDPVIVAVAALREGKIVALRGIGGFHLAVDATNGAAVRRLREKKRRLNRPFALMADSVEGAQAICELDEPEKKLLLDPRAPIVLLRRRTDTAIAPEVSPDNEYFGVMLCYTPLHHLLMRGNFRWLVMTSGNVSEEPIAIGNREALERLRNIADVFILHNRDILQRADDSILMRCSSKTFFVRRARGYVPGAIRLPCENTTSILACGPDLKNCPALVRGSQAFLTQHVGDLDHPLSLGFFEHAIGHMKRILDIEPEMIVCDAHPEYRSTRWATQQKEIPVVPVQHHHAHLVSVMADNGVCGPVVGLILDGTGFGVDGTIWGGEILVGDATGFDRAAWLEPVPMPGGEAAAREPWRMAASMLYRANIPVERWNDYLSVDRAKLSLVRKMLDNKFNSPLTSSCGRLFDAVAGLLNLVDYNEYEAQAAIKLETLAGRCVIRDFEQTDQSGVPSTQGALSTQALFLSLVDDLDRGVSHETIAHHYHYRLAELLVGATLSISKGTGISQVGLSGGVWQNRILYRLVHDMLSAKGLDVLVHRQVPCNDGGISLGQALIGALLQGSLHRERGNGGGQCVWQYPVNW